MTEKTTKTEETTVERDRYTEPRERDEDGHQDAGQEYVERDRARTGDEEQKSS